MAGLLMTAERSETEIGVDAEVDEVGVPAWGLLDWTRRRAAAMVGEERAAIGDCALGVVRPDIFTADT